MTNAELHAHIFMDGADYQKSVERNRNAPDEAHIRKVFETYKKAGITFIREGGDHFGVCKAAKEIAPEYGITYIMPAFAIYKNGNYGKVAGKSYSTLNEYAGLVEEAKKQGADFIKLMLSGILDFNRYGEISKSEYSLSEMKELCRIAHESGFAVMAHVNGPELINRALSSGIDSLEHGYYIDSEGIAALKESGCVWVPTAVTGSNLSGRGRYDEAELLKIVDRHKENIRLAFEAGVNIGCGCDAGAFGVLHAEGTLQEEALLLEIMGSSGNKVLQKSFKIIKRLFSSHSA